MFIENNSNNLEYFGSISITFSVVQKEMFTAICLLGNKLNSGIINALVL